MKSEESSMIWYLGNEVFTYSYANNFTIFSMELECQSFSLADVNWLLLTLELPNAYNTICSMATDLCHKIQGFLESLLLSQIFNCICYIVLVYAVGA